MTMPAALTAEKNKLSQEGCWVWLIDFVLPNSGGTLRFASNTEDVTYRGNTYSAFAFSIESLVLNVDGKLPTLDLHITNVGLALQQYIRDYEGFVDGTVTLTYVNTELLGQDYSEDARTFTVLGCDNQLIDVTLHLGVPSALRRRVPKDKYSNSHCRHKWQSGRCGYVGEDIVSISLPSGSEVSIEVTGHGLPTGTEVLLETVSGITPSLNGVYTITSVDANQYTLDGTDGGDYSGSYSSGGKAGWAYCPRHKQACRDRQGTAAPYGGQIGVRPNALKFAV